MNFTVYARFLMPVNNHVAFATRTEAYDAVEGYIEGFYNPSRRHSALGYFSPLQYERETVSIAA